MTEVSEDDGDDGVSPSTAVVEMLVTVEEVGEGASPQPVGSPVIDRLSMLHLYCCCNCTCLTPKPEGQNEMSPSICAFFPFLSFSLL